MEVGKSKENRDTVLHIRVGKSENNYLKRVAKQSDLSVSDYIRKELFGDMSSQLSEGGIANTKSKFACDHERELMRLTMRMYLYMKEISRSNLPEDVYKRCNVLAKEALEEWGYE